MATSILDRLLAAQKENPSGLGTWTISPTGNRKYYFSRTSAFLSNPSEFGLTKTPKKYAGSPSAFVK